MTKPKLTFDISQKNTRIKLGSFDFELRYVTFGDTKFFIEICEKELPSRKFVLKVLHHQLVRPTFTFAEFASLSDEQIHTLAKSFIKSEGNMFAHYQESGDFYKDFQTAIEVYKKERIDKMLIGVSETLKITKASLAAFQIDYSDILKPITEASRWISETSRTFTQTALSINQMAIDLNASLIGVAEEFRAVSRALSESLAPQIDLWGKWISEQASFFASFDSKWLELAKEYRIQEDKAVEVLKKYKWFVSPNLPANIIADIVHLGSKKGRQDKAINKLFYDYFSKDNWNNLRYFVSVWERRKTVKPSRIKILKSISETATQTDEGVNLANVIVPTLISQIDGLLYDYMNKNGIKYKTDYMDYTNKKGKLVKGRLTQFQKYSPRVLGDKMDELASDLFLNVLFQSSKRGKELSMPFYFNRHKIMHGENANYGKKPYLIRCILLIDYLVCLEDVDS